MRWATFIPMDWRGWIEVLILWIGLYYAWRSLRGTRGAKVLTGLVSILFFIVVVSGFLELPVLGWMFKNHRTQQRMTDLYFFVTPTMLSVKQTAAAER